MSANERLFREPKVFDAEFSIKFALMCVIAFGVVALCWSYSFKNNVVLALNDSNEKMFNDRFVSLSAESNWGDYSNISGYAQRMVTLKNIDRSGYGIDGAVFSNLPFIPANWSRLKFAFDGGKTFVMGMMEPEYYMQPEFYDDWFTVGLPFYKSHDQVCQAGFFAEPYVQKIYTNVGSSVRTYSIIRTSFCVDQPQALSLIPMYPSYVESLDNENYKQDPNIVRQYVSVKADPSYAMLGEAYPKFSKNWAQKVSVTITVAQDAPKGIYVVALGAGKYDPWLGKMTDVNYDAYKSKNGAPLAHYIVAVD